MALPPEQINIKRRREEEPVETLCTVAPPFPSVCLVFFYPTIQTAPVGKPIAFDALSFPIKLPICVLCFSSF